MGLSTRKHDHAWHCHGSCRGTDRGKAPSRLRTIRGGANCLIGLFLAFVFASAGAAADLRLASYHAELTRKGPGLLLRDLTDDPDPQLRAVRDVIWHVDPDILLLTKLDYDLEGRTLAALQAFLGRYPHSYTQPPNSLRKLAFDLNGDGTGAGAGDRQAWAHYAGAGAMALLSKHPIDVAQSYSLNDLLWRALSGARLPEVAGRPFPSQRAHDALRLATQGVWVVRITPKTRPAITVLAFQNTTPAFDGPEDFNGLRNRDQLRLLSGVIAGEHGAFPSAGFALMGQGNIDPERGQGWRETMQALLALPALQDPRPIGSDGRAVTADFNRPEPGALRLTYILPSADWRVVGSGVVWPDTGLLVEPVLTASRHRLVWVDIKAPP